MTKTATETSHTPGPWTANQFGNQGVWDIHRSTPTLDGGYFGRVEPLHVTREALDEAAANARLIAAAPDLLAACLHASKFAADGSYEDFCEMKEHLLDAIAKAGGGAA